MFLLNLFGFNFLTALLTLLLVLYYFLTKNFNYWKSHGIDGPKPIAIFGTFHNFIFGSISELYVEFAQKYGNIFGEFMGCRPALTISDPELIKTIGIKDFLKFVDRNDFIVGDLLNEKALFNLTGDEWKSMRSIINPTFSSGKMRRMHPIIIDCVNRLETALDKCLEKSNEIDLKKVMGNLTIDVIATCAFGTVIDIYNDEKTNDFFIYSKKVFIPGWRGFLFFLIAPVFPKILKWFEFKIIHPEADHFFRTVIQSIVSQRMSDKRQHNDYLQLLLNAQNKIGDREEQIAEVEVREKIEGIFGQKSEKLIPRVKFDITDDLLVSNIFIFIIAGYETTASLLTHLFYSLAVNEECQQKLYEEIKTFDGKFNYENINKMSYMEACVAETLRRYPTLPFITRMASEEYTIPQNGLTIPKGMIVNINIQAIHFNPEYYPNPEQFDPERFMPENSHKLVPYTYLPFGIGPRHCVGMRFALMEAKTAIAHLINKYKLFRTDKTKVPLKPNKGEFLLNHGDIHIGFKLRT